MHPWELSAQGEQVQRAAEHMARKDHESRPGMMPWDELEPRTQAAYVAGARLQIEYVLEAFAACDVGSNQGSS